MQESKLTSRGQTTLPNAVRKALSLATGDRVRYFIVNGEVRFRKVHPVTQAEGILARRGQKATSLDQMHKAVARRVAKGAHRKT